MKTITKSIRLMAILFAFLATRTMYSQLCTASFNYTLGANGSVTFISTSLGTNSVTTQYFWTFGNGNTFTTVGSPMASQTYSANGTYTVNLFFFTAPSCSATTTQTILITNATGCALNANFSAFPSLNGSYSFVNTSVGTTTSTTFHWNFGDGGTSNQLSPLHQYLTPGNYLVTLIDSNSISCVSTKTLLLNSCGAQASFSINTGPNGQILLTSTTPNTNSLTVYNWTITGNSYFHGSGNAPGSYSLNLPANGIYTVSMYMSFSCGGWGLSTQTINITNVLCSLNASFNLLVTSNGQVNFTSTSTGTTLSTTYSWNFGSGQSTGVGNIPVVSNTYSANGTYTVTLYVNNNSIPACSDSALAVVTVTNASGNPCNLNASFTYSLGPNGVVNIFNTSTGTTSNTTYFYVVPGPGLISLLPNPTFTFTSNGTYTVKLGISNPGTTPLCYDSAAPQLITISNITVPCNLSTSFAHTVGANGLVNFASTSIGTNTTTSYFWNFGDGTFGAGNNPSHTYGTSGTHIVVLTAMNGSTVCANSSTQSINITGIPCVANANFSLSPTNVPQYWTATPAYPWNVTAASWSWGDGSSSNLLYASHTYSAAGMYTICLTVTVSCGSTASACSSYSVYKMSSAANMIEINVEAPALVPVGVETIVSNGFEYTLFPNPSKGSFEINTNDFGNGNMTISISNLIGQEVFAEEVKTTNGKSYKVESMNLATGIYMVHLNVGGKTFSKKMIVQD